MVARGSCQVNARKGRRRVKQKGGRGRGDFEGEMTERTEDNREIQKIHSTAKGEAKGKERKKKESLEDRQKIEIAVIALWRFGGMWLAGGNATNTDDIIRKKEVKCA